MNLKRAQQNGTFLELGPLVGDDFHKYLHQLLNLSDDYPVPAKLTQYVQEKSQGNPFFVAELLQVNTATLPTPIALSIAHRPPTPIRPNLICPCDSIC